MANRVYYTWLEDDGTYNQLWHGVSDADGGNLAIVKLTTSSFDKDMSRIFLRMEKVYYIWRQIDGSNKWQLWLGESAYDGSSFSQQVLTNTSFDVNEPQMFVYKDKIYYAWTELDAIAAQVWFAYSDLNGGNFVSAKMTSLIRDADAVCVVVLGSKVYFVWDEFDVNVIDKQVWFATSTLTGENFTTTKQTSGALGNRLPVIAIDAGTIYYSYLGEDTDNWQIYHAISNLDGTGFTATKLTTGAFDEMLVDLSVRYNKVYYVWEEEDGLGDYQIWTGISDLDGTNFTATKQTTSAGSKNYTSIQKAGSNLRYAWAFTDGAYIQVHFGYSDDNGGNFTDVTLTSSAVDRTTPAFIALVTVPSESVTRVTNIIHRYDRLTQYYGMEIIFGGVQSDFEVPNWLTPPQSAIKPDIAEEVRNVVNALKDMDVFAKAQELYSDVDWSKVHLGGMR